MINPARGAIEQRIRELSHQLFEEQGSRQKQGQNQVISLPLLEEMMEEWFFKLTKYYEANLYEYESSEPRDLEMSLFMVKNYFQWVDNLGTHIRSAVNDGDQDYADELEECLMTLEHAMRDILKATADHDEFED